VAVSTAVRTYYAERIFARSGREEAPPNFRPLDVAPTGRFTVEGCRGGGKNILEIQLVGTDDRVADLRLACGLCNPAMYACADVVADWARGRGLDEILALDPLEVANLAPFFERLGGPGRPDDAREKFQYVLLALQRAVLDHRGEAAPPLPGIPEHTGRDLDDDYDDD
jgi:hypothetical protein